jgi:hypothetical protein
MGDLSNDISPDRVLNGFEKTQNLHLGGPALSLTQFDALKNNGIIFEEENIGEKMYKKGLKKKELKE